MKNVVSLLCSFDRDVTFNKFYQVRTCLTFHAVQPIKIGQ